jgi:small conductance mechanosensitive channel
MRVKGKIQMNMIMTNMLAVKEDMVLPAWVQNVLPGVLEFLLNIVWAVLVLIIGIKLVNWVIKILAKALEKGKVDPGVGTFLCSVAKYALYFVLALLVLSAFGVTTGSVIAVLGSLGVTIGLALQGSLSNLAGGVLILLLKPFVLGDYIIEMNTNQEGTVEAITIFYTRLLTTDNKRIMIPNGVLSNTSIVNVTAMDKRRLNLVVGVAYDSDIAKVKEVLTEIVMNEECRMKEEPCDVFVSELADSSIQMGVRFWVKKEDYWTTKWRITENIKLAFDANDISIPFPQLDVQIKQ